MTERRSLSQPRAVQIQRLWLGGFAAPAEYAKGQRVVVNGWVIEHAEGRLLLDTGFGPHNEAHLPPEYREELRVLRRPIEEELGSIGLKPSDIDAVVNCHLHADHASGNIAFRGIPIWAQRPEFEAAQDPDYSVPEDLDLTDGDYRVVDGAVEILPGIELVPTPGHTAGHQALVVHTDDGPIIFAGQAFRGASEFAMALHAMELERIGFEPVPPYPEWLPQLIKRDPWRVTFAHDWAVWQREA